MMKPEEQNRISEAAQKLDEDIDRFMESLAERGKKIHLDSEKKFDFNKWCEEIDKHPAFAREVKPTESGEYSTEMQALQAMKYDEDDPTECAKAYKEEGNRHFEHKNYRWAVDAYTKGVRLDCADGCLNSVLFANRAAANKRLGNIRSAFRDCCFARRYDSKNVKAIRRGAECLLELREAAKCTAWIESSSSLEKDEQLEILKKKAEAMRAERERDARRERAKESAERRRNVKLLEALRTRGVRLCPTVDGPDELCQHLQISFGPLEKHSMVRLTEEGTDNEQLIWPLLLQYPESGQTDFVTECAERDPLADALSEAFSSPAHWDFSHQFRSDNVRLFVALSSCDGKECIREILPPKHSLGAILRWPDVFVNRGLPVIQIYTRQHLECNELREIDGENGIFYFHKR